MEVVLQVVSSTASASVSASPSAYGSVSLFVIVHLCLCLSPSFLCLLFHRLFDSLTLVLLHVFSGHTATGVKPPWISEHWHAQTWQMGRQTVGYFIIGGETKSLSLIVIVAQTDLHRYRQHQMLIVHVHERVA